MAHDGQTLDMTNITILTDLTTLTSASVDPIETLFATAKTALRHRVSVDGKVSAFD
jgi:(2S)-methylsuccinyl-CoA dehydrogenase